MNSRGSMKYAMGNNGSDKGTRNVAYSQQVNLPGVSDDNNS